MTDKKVSNINNIFKVFFSNALSILSGFVIVFLISSILDYEGYGLYKTYTLFINYVGFFGFGLVEGIALKFGGVDFNNLDKKNFRTFFVGYLLLNIVLLIIILGISFFAFNDDFFIILSAYALYIFSYNLTNFFQQISQITMRFNDFTIKNNFKSIFNIVVILLVYIYYRVYGVDIGYIFFVYLTVFINFLILISYFIMYREFVFGERTSFKEIKTDFFSMIKSGLPVLLSTFCFTLLLNFDKQIVNIYFEKEVFAVYSFAYSLMNLIVVAINAVAVVLFPILKRKEDDVVRSAFPILIRSILVIVAIGMISYYPLYYLCDLIVPKYNSSFEYLQIIFPILIFNALISIIYSNYAKLYNKNKQFLLNAIVTLIVAFILINVVYFLSKDLSLISVSMLFVMFIWFILNFVTFRSFNDKKWLKDILFVILLIGIFCFTATLSNKIIGMISYFGLSLVLSILFYLKDILNKKSILIDILK